MQISASIADTHSCCCQRSAWSRCSPVLTEATRAQWRLRSLRRRSSDPLTADERLQLWIQTRSFGLRKSAAASSTLQFRLSPWRPRHVGEHQAPDAEAEPRR